MRTTVDVVLAKPAPTPDELLGMGRDVRAAVDHAEALIESLLTLARTDRGLTRREPVDLATLVEDAVDAVNNAGTPRLHLPGTRTDDRRPDPAGAPHHQPVRQRAAVQRARR
jgi:signal transduction histidine kinase